MEYRQRTDEPHKETTKYLSGCMVLENHAGGAQHASDKEEEANPPDGIVGKKVAEGNYATQDCPRPGHVFTQLPPEIDHHTDDEHQQGGQDDTGHVPGDIESVHHHEAKDIGCDGQNERHETPLPLAHLLVTELVDLLEQEDAECRHQDGEAIDYTQNDELIGHRHDAQIGEEEEDQEGQKGDGKGRENERYHPGNPDQCLVCNEMFLR